jgi:hypothetical protein
MKVTRQQLRKVIKEAIKEEMEMSDPLAMLDRAAALAESLLEDMEEEMLISGDERLNNLVEILNRLHSSLADTM